MRKTITVSELTGRISLALENHIGYVSVEGELSNYKAHSSGHRYFTLKDSGASVSCAMWRSRKLEFLPKDGMKVVVSGVLSVYPPRGQYQIDCDSMTPYGKGDLFIAFEELKRKLGEAGYFDESQKKPIPKYVSSVGVSTSPTGAAVKDIFSTIERRFPLVKVFFRPTLVQGEGSAEDIASAISELEKTDAQVIIIARGGGSIEDLWSYNTEIVADSIFNCSKPLISAVGHETDFTIADFVADLRAATPTASAEIVTSNTKDYFLDFLDSAKHQMTKYIKTTISDYYKTIDNLASQRAFAKFGDIILRQHQYIDDIESSLSGSLTRRLEANNEKLKSYARHIKSLNPLSPLNKGFSLLMKDGIVLNNEEKLNQCDKIAILRKHEKAIVEVLSTESQNYY